MLEKVIGTGTNGAITATESGSNFLGEATGVCECVWRASLVVLICALSKCMYVLARRSKEQGDMEVKTARQDGGKETRVTRGSQAVHCKAFNHRRVLRKTPLPPNSIQDGQGQGTGGGSMLHKQGHLISEEQQNPPMALESAHQTRKFLERPLDKQADADLRREWRRKHGVSRRSRVRKGILFARGGTAVLWGGK